MMLSSLKIIPKTPLAIGATPGQDLLREVRAELDSAENSDLALVLDLSGVSAVNGSFLKATVLWALQCGQAAAQQRDPLSADEWAVRPLRLYPAVLGCTGEVTDEVRDFFHGRRLPVLHLAGARKPRPHRSEVIGELDPVLAGTLKALASVGEATAADLAARSSETITTSGWSNRLADLYLLRLVTRRRQGKFWVYAPVADNISL